LFTVCALNELFFIALYLLSFSSPFLSPNLLQQVPSVAAGSEATPKLIQQVYNNPYSAGALELARANKMVSPPNAHFPPGGLTRPCDWLLILRRRQDSTVPWILAGISAPVMALKQFINVVQLVKASQRLAEMDRKARNAKGLPKKNSPAKQ